MAASFTRGTTFVNGQEVDSADLNDLITLAAVEGIDRSDRDVAAPEFFVTADTAPPASQEALESWYNTTTGWWLTITAGGDHVSVIPGGHTITMSGDAVAGQVLYPVSYDGTTFVMAVVVAGTNTWQALAVAAQDIADGESGVAIFTGPCRIKIASNASPTPGQALQVSGIEDGVVTTIGPRGSGHGPRAFATAYRNSSGGYVWAMLFK